MSTVVAHDVPQPLKKNAVQEIDEDCKKANNTSTFTKHNVNNGFVNKSTKSGKSHNNHNGIQNSYSKTKITDENYCPSNSKYTKIKKDFLLHYKFFLRLLGNM